MEKERKSAFLIVRISVAEKNYLIEKASEGDISLSDLVRDLIDCGWMYKGLEDE